MKTFISLVGTILLFVNLIGAQRIPPLKPVIVKVTSTECNICGLSAWDTFKEVVEDYEEKAVIMAVHPLEESQLFSNTSLEFADNLSGFFGTPTLYINDESHFQYWLKGIKDFIEPYKERQVLAHPFISYTIVGDQLQVAVKTKFLKASNRAHYISVYVVEDQVIAYQNSRGPEDKHSKVLRTHLGEDAFEVLYSDSAIEENDEFTNNYTLDIDSTWNTEKLEIAAIIWEKRGETYHVVNSNTALEPSLSTSVNALEAANVWMTVQPTILDNTATIKLDLPQAQQNLNLSLINSLGQQTKLLFSGDLTSGQHSFSINRNDYLNKGLHFLVLEKEGAKIVRKVMVK